MIKRTLNVGNPAYLKTTNEQMVIETQDSSETELVPIEDIGIVVLDHQQITITQAVASIHLPGFGNLEGVALTC
jgi:CRISPR-associated protein Cas1